jgi:hypothetical protein
MLTSFPYLYPSLIQVPPGLANEALSKEQLKMVREDLTCLVQGHKGNRAYLTEKLKSYNIQDAEWNQAIQALDAGDPEAIHLISAQFNIFIPI